MQCIKCGKDTVGSAVFCNECLADMAQHPVKPGTPVILPKRTVLSPAKHTRKRTLKPEQQVHSLKVAVRLLITLVILLIAALTVSIMLTVHFMEESSSTLPVGLSYYETGYTESTGL